MLSVTQLNLVLKYKCFHAIIWPATGTAGTCRAASYLLYLTQCTGQRGTGSNLSETRHEPLAQLRNMLHSRRGGGAQIDLDVAQSGSNAGGVIGAPNETRAQRLDERRIQTI